MQRRAFLIGGLMAGLAPAARAADAVVEGFSGFSATGAIPLERHTGVMKVKKRDPVGAVMINFYELWGERSRVRFTPATVPSFVVNGPADGDPMARYALFRLTVAKRARHLETGRTIGGGQTNLNIQERFKVAFTAVRYGADFFKLDVVNPLTPGEYAWVSAGAVGSKSGGWEGFGGKDGAPTIGIYAFGVD